MEAERQRHLLMDRGGAGHRLALGVEHHGIAAAQHVLMRESVAVEPAAEIVEPLAALTQQALGGAVEAWGVVGQAPPRALDLDAQQIGPPPPGEAGDAATLEGEEMLEGAACPLCRIGKGTLLLTDLLARMTQPSRQGRDLAAPQAQARGEGEAEPLAAVVEQLRLGADEGERVGQAARQPLEPYAPI